MEFSSEYAARTKLIFTDKTASNKYGNSMGVKLFRDSNEKPDTLEDTTPLREFEFIKLLSGLDLLNSQLKLFEVASEIINI